MDRAVFHRRAFDLSWADFPPGDVERVVDPSVKESEAVLVLLHPVTWSQRSSHVPQYSSK
jgi:hypothetical protein